MKTYTAAAIGLLSIGSVLFNAACDSQSASANVSQPPGAPTVAVVEVSPQVVPIYSEYVAQTFARDQLRKRPGKLPHPFAQH